MDTFVYVEWLEKAVERKLADNSIGLPVALRAQLNLSSDHGLLAPSLAGLASAAERWFASKALTVYAQGGGRVGVRKPSRQVFGRPNGLAKLRGRPWQWGAWRRGAERLTTGRGEPWHHAVHGQSAFRWASRGHRASGWGRSAEIGPCYRSVSSQGEARIPRLTRKNRRG